MHITGSCHKSILDNLLFIFPNKLVTRSYAVLRVESFNASPDVKNKFKMFSWILQTSLKENQTEYQITSLRCRPCFSCCMLCRFLATFFLSSILIISDDSSFSLSSSGCRFFASSADNSCRWLTMSCELYFCGWSAEDSFFHWPGLL